MREYPTMASGDAAVPMFWAVRATSIFAPGGTVTGAT
jgi:hypothetical protein